MESKHVSKSKVSVIIVAAGESRRMNGIDKLMAPLAGKPVLEWSIEAFQQNPHVDRIILNSAGGLEVKTTGREGEEWGEEGTDEVPRHYFIQVQHYMAVTEREFFNIALLAGGQRFRLFHVERDESFISDMTALEVEFWQHVVTREPPYPETSEEANRRWPISREGEVQADPIVAEAVSKLAEAKAIEKRVKEDQEHLELIIKAALGDTGDTLMKGTVKLATWKTSKGYHVEAFDVKPTRKLLLAKQKEERK